MSPKMQLVGLPAPARHAMQALAYLAAHPERAFDTVSVARRFRLPAASLAKSFQLLAGAGLLISKRGPNGGYRLGAAAGDITLASVVSVLGGSDRRRGHCLLEERACSPDGSCALHDAAVQADEGLLRTLTTLTVADLRIRTQRR